MNGPTIRLNPPRGYESIKPLYRHDDRPLWDRRIVVPEIHKRPDCTHCVSKACRSGTCDSKGSRL